MLFLSALFAFRVLAQLLQALVPVPFLPPFSHWQSGVLPYPLLLGSQLVILALLARVAYRHAQNRVAPLRETGRRLLILGGLYAGTMVARYVLHMARVPADRWLGGCIPIFFHLVLAGFLLTVGLRHFRHGPPGAAGPSGLSVSLWRSAVSLLVLGILIWTANRLCAL